MLITSVIALLFSAAALTISYLAYRRTLKQDRHIGWRLLREVKDNGQLDYALAREGGGTARDVEVVVSGGILLQWGQRSLEQVDPNAVVWVGGGPPRGSYAPGEVIVTWSAKSGSAKSTFRTQLL